MGHKNKTAARDAVVLEAKRLATNANSKIAEFVKQYKRNEQIREISIHELETRVHKQLNALAAVVAELRDDFELERRPIWKKAIAWIEDVLQKAPSSSPAPKEDSEVIDIDFDDEETDPAVVVTMDGRPADIGQEDAGRAEGEPKSDAISEDDQEDDIEPFTLAEIAKASDEIIESSRKRNEENDKRKILEKLHDPVEILKRLEWRRDAEKGIVADLMENQDFDQEEKAQAIENALDRIEEFDHRIAHQKLVIAGFKEAPEDGSNSKAL